MIEAALGLPELADRVRVLSITASSAPHRRSRASSSQTPIVPGGSSTGRRPRYATAASRKLAGYRDAQDYLFQEDWQPLNAGLILILIPHLHRLLFAHTAAFGGAFKTEDNLVVDRSPDGSTGHRAVSCPADPQWVFARI